MLYKTFLNTHAFNKQIKLTKKLIIKAQAMHIIVKKKKKQLNNKLFWFKIINNIDRDSLKKY